MRQRSPRSAVVVSMTCMLAALAVTSARGDENAKVLSDPQRTYDPATHRVGMTVRISENAESFVIGAQGIATTYSAEFFCKKHCSRRTGGCFQQCSVGLYYAWDDSPAAAGRGLHRDSWTYVRACAEDGSCSEPVYEERVMCDADGGSGCPCWIFVRTDPDASCGPSYEDSRSE